MNIWTQVRATQIWFDAVALKLRKVLGSMKREGIVSIDEHDDAERKVLELQEFFVSKKQQAKNLSETSSLKLCDILSEMSGKKVVMFDVLEDGEKLRDKMKKLRNPWFDVQQTMDEVVKQLAIGGVIPDEKYAIVTRRLNKLNDSIQEIERLLQDYVAKNSWV